MVKEKYRGYLISGVAVLITETDEKWFSPRGQVYRLENGEALYVTDCRSKYMFKSELSAEHKALDLCRQWIDREVGSRPH